jgi:ABC-type Fe3+-hydroxamate transport system substrate-binding protein
MNKVPNRVISLVPSMTDSLIELGLVDRLIGVTENSSILEPMASRISLVGTPEMIDVERIISMAPDIVLANKAENESEGIERLQEAGISIWGAFPHDVAENIYLLWSLVTLFMIQTSAAPKMRYLEMTLDWVVHAFAQIEPVRYFCPIWQSEEIDRGICWKTFGPGTYHNDLLRICGGVNIFSQNTSHYPLAFALDARKSKATVDKTIQYLHVSASDVVKGKPDVILLPDIPYNFQPVDIAILKKQLSDTPAIRQGRVLRLDGRLIFWYGTRMACALANLPPALEK